MNKMNWCCIFILLLCATDGFAQFRSAPKAARNLARLDRIVEQAVAPQVSDRVIVRVPHGMISGNKTVLTAAKLPQQVTAVNASLHYYHAQQPKPSTKAVVAWKNLPMQEGWLASGGQAFYDNQARLARDLNTFYGGSGSSVEFGGKTVKLYALPVEGILYKPAGYTDAVLLDCEETFVIYDPVAKTGQLVENSPAMQQAFSRQVSSGSFEEVANFDGQKFNMPLGEPASVSSMEKPAFEEAPQPDSFSLYEQDYQSFKYARERRNLDAAWEAQYPSRFSSQNDLGKALHAFHKGLAARIKNNITRQVSYIYEIPHSALTYAPEGSVPLVLNPEAQVVLYNEKGEGQLVNRSSLTNSFIFTFVQ